MGCEADGAKEDGISSGHSSGESPETVNSFSSVSVDGPVVKGGVLPSSSSSSDDRPILQKARRLEWRLGDPRAYDAPEEILKNEILKELANDAGLAYVSCRLCAPPDRRLQAADQSDEEAPALCRRPCLLRSWAKK